MMNRKMRSRRKTIRPDGRQAGEALECDCEHEGDAGGGDGHGVPGEGEVQEAVAPWDGGLEEGRDALGSRLLLKDHKLLGRNNASSTCWICTHFLRIPGLLLLRIHAAVLTLIAAGLAATVGELAIS